MKTCSTSRRLARPHPADPFLTIALHMGEVYADEMAEETAPRLLFAATFDDEGVDLYVNPILGHPEEELLGFTAPAEWDCIGISTGAWASQADLNGRGVPRPTGTDRRRVRMLHTVARTGEAINIFRDPPADPVVTRWFGVDDGERGYLDDLLRRSLGLPTAPPAASTLGWWATRWLGAVYHEAKDGRLREAPWPALVELHPAWEVVRADEHRQLAQFTVSRLDRVGEMLAQSHPWTRVHTDAASGAVPDVEATWRVTRDVIEWMDAGMFARHVRSATPPIEDVLLELHDLLDAAAYCRVVDTIGAWGLLAA